MTLTSVHEGDIVQIAEGVGYGYYALVRDKKPGTLRIFTLTGPRGQYRTVKARQVVAHWARRGG